MSFFLGVDLGGTVIKAGIYSGTGEEMAVYEHSAALLSEHEGFAERNMDELWQAVCIVTRGALEKAGLSANEIKGVSFSSHGKGLLLLIKKENRFATVLSPLIQERLILLKNGSQKVLTINPTLMVYNRFG